MTELHNDGQDRAQRAAMQRCGSRGTDMRSNVQIAAEAGRNFLEIVERARNSAIYPLPIGMAEGPEANDWRESAEASDLIELFEAVESALDDYTSSIAKSAKLPAYDERHERTMQQEHGLGHAQLGVSRGRGF